MPLPSRSAGTGEEERAAVRLHEMCEDLALLDHGRQLMQIGEQQQTHAAEGLARPPAIDAQRLVDRPHQIGAHHRGFVDDEEIELAHDATVAAAADVAFLDETRREAEEGMDGLAADVDGGEAGRREHDHASS